VSETKDKSSQFTSQSVGLPLMPDFIGVLSKQYTITLEDHILKLLVEEWDSTGWLPLNTVRDKISMNATNETFDIAIKALREIEYIEFKGIPGGKFAIKLLDEGRMFFDKGHKFGESYKNYDSTFDSKSLIIPASDRVVTFGDNSGVIIQGVRDLTININSHNEWKATEDKEIAQLGMSFLNKIVNSKAVKWTLIASGLVFLTWLKTTYTDHVISQIADQLITLLQAVGSK
jgi:hypothetical protein